MKISIALCTYNGEFFLEEQLNSFLAQTRLPDELIICDDLSTDSTLQIIEKFSNQAPFQVRSFVHPENIGSTRNFEQAISHCQGDFIFLADQDDYWLPEKIEMTMQEFEKNKAVGMVFTDAELVNEKLQPLNRKLCDLTYQKADRNEIFFNLLLKKHIVTGATMAFRKEFVEKIMPIPTTIPNLIHDAWISLVIAANAEVKFIDKPLIKYRQHANQQLGIAGQFKKGEKSYQKSIAYLFQEIDRLNYLQDYLQNFPYFRDKNSDDLIKIQLLEKRDLIAHFEARMTLPTNKLRRAMAIIAEFKTGRYTKFSNGWMSAVKDIF